MTHFLMTSVVHFIYSLASVYLFPTKIKHTGHSPTKVHKEFLLGGLIPECIQHFYSSYFNYPTEFGLSTCISHIRFTAVQEITGQFKDI